MPLKITKIKEPEFTTRARDPDKILRELWRRFSMKDGEKVLEELANLAPGECERFWSRWGWLFFYKESDVALLAVRDEVRQVWWFRPMAERIIGNWLAWQPPPDTVWLPRLMVDADKKWLGPNPANLRSLLAFSVVEYGPRLARCENPDCSRPYYLRSRKNQRFCGVPDCVIVGQRQYKRAWWAKHGKEWRRRRRRRKQRKPRKQGRAG